MENFDIVTPPEIEPIGKRGGFWKQFGMLVFGTPQDCKPVCAPEEIYIPGEHNLKNALAATATRLG